MSSQAGWHHQPITVIRYIPEIKRENVFRLSFLKALTLGLLSFLLFLSISIFGLAFTLDRTVLNPGFLTSELDRLDISSILEETIDEQITSEDLPQGLKTALVNSTRRLEPLLKEEIGIIIDHVYDYLLGRNDSPDMRQVLRTTFLNSEFMAAFIDELDLPSLTDEISQSCH